MTQLNRRDLAGMTPAQIDEAHRTGRLAQLLGAPEEEVQLLERAQGQLAPSDIAALARLNRHDLIDAAFQEGRCSLTEQEN